MVNSCSFSGGLELHQGPSAHLHDGPSLETRDAQAGAHLPAWQHFPRVVTCHPRGDEARPMRLPWRGAPDTAPDATPGTFANATMSPFAVTNRNCDSDCVLCPQSDECLQHTLEPGGSLGDP